MGEIAFASNSLEILADKLHENLFRDLPLSPSFIVVENKNQKEWLQVRFAKKYNVITVVKFVDIDTLFELLLQKNWGVPKEFELNLAIAQKVLQEEKKIPIIANYLKTSTTKQKVKRLIHLCNTLTELFLDYFKASDIDKKEDWQIKLFKEVLKDRNWISLSQILNKPIPPLNYCTIHLFNHTFLPKSYSKLLSKIAEKCNLFHYNLSFSPYFLGDISTNEEKRAKIQFFKEKHVKKALLDELTGYLDNGNPLLNNMGKASKNYFNLLDEKEIPVFDHYKEEEEKTLLDSLKSDLFFMKETSDKPNSLDSSLKIKSATSKIREIELLKEHVLKLMKEGIPLSNISIFAPDIGSFLPLIEMIFPPLEYKINDIEIAVTSDFLKGILQFFALIDSRLEKDKILNLFHNAAFKKRFNLDEKDLDLIEWWIDKAKIISNVNNEELFSSSLGKKSLQINSWEEGFKRLLYNFANPTREIQLPSYLKNIDLSQIEILEKFIAIFTSLKEDIEILKTNPSFTLQKWQEVLNDIFHEYFKIDDAEEQRTKCYDFLLKLKKTSLLFKEEAIPFQFILNSLKKAIIKTGEGRHHDIIEGLHFSSFKEGAITSSDVICLIGMDEESFDFKKNNLHLFQEEFLSKGEKYRHLFLQSLINAKKRLFISFVGYTREGKRKSANPVLEEFFSYLKRFHNLQNFIEPTSSITQGQDKILDERSYRCLPSDTNNIGSTGLISGGKTIFPTIEEAPINSDDLDETIDLKELLLLAKNPIKFYYNKVLELFLDDDAPPLFTLSSLDRFYLQKEALFSKADIEDLDKKGVLPPGIFNACEKSKLKDEFATIQKNLSLLHIEEKGLFKLIISDTKAGEKVDVVVPPIEIPFLGKRVKIVGELLCTKEGILLNCDSSKINLFKNWPIFALLPHLFIEKRAFFIDAKIKSFENLSKDLLMQYLHYFYRAKKSISPFLPQLGASFFKRSGEDIKELILKSANGFFIHDIYLQRHLQKVDIIDCNNIIKWQNALLPVFKPLLEDAIDEDL